MHFKLLSLNVLVGLIAMAVLGAGSVWASEPKIEPSSLFPVTFTGSGGTTVLEATPKDGKQRRVHCTGTTSSGEISNASTAKNVKMVLTGCTSTGPFGTNWICASSGAPSGQIRTVPLHGTVVYLTTNTSTTGILLKPEAGTTIAQFVCKDIFLSQTITVSDSVIGHLTPVNTSTKSFTLSFEQSSGHQKFDDYLANVGCSHAGGAPSVVATGAESYGPLELGLGGSQTLTTAQNIKINASKCE